MANAVEDLITRVNSTRLKPQGRSAKPCGSTHSTANKSTGRQLLHLWPTRSLETVENRRSFGSNEIGHLRKNCPYTRRGDWLPPRNTPQSNDEPGTLRSDAGANHQETTAEPKEQPGHIRVVEETAEPEMD